LFFYVKGYKSIGRTLTEYKIKKVEIKEPLPYVPLEIEVDEDKNNSDNGSNGSNENQIELEL